jgi:hypothetical protein
MSLESSNYHILIFLGDGVRIVRQRPPRRRHLHGLLPRPDLLPVRHVAPRLDR